MARLIHIGFENFMKFADYQGFNISPFTILTGANNSGKSSLIKALLLLSDNAQTNGLKKLDFENEKHRHLLPNFDAIVNRVSHCKTTTFVIDYIINNHYQLKVKINYTDAQLDSVSLINDEGVENSHLADVAFVVKHIDFEYWNDTIDCKSVLSDEFVSFWKKELGIDKELNLGRGSKQLVSLLKKLASSKNKILLVENPENNLHPNTQSLLAAIFADAKQRFDIQLIIETHSEYLIRNFQILAAQKTISAKDILIYDFQANRVETIQFFPNGILNGEFSTGFFDQASQLKLELIKYKTF